MPVQVTRFTVPPAGVDIVDITLHETYRVEGVGEDTVLLKGELEAHRSVPLLGQGAQRVDWQTSTVVAKFENLSLAGDSNVFGPVRVTLDRSIPSFGVVTAGKCAASMALRVTMPKLGLVMRSAEPVQLQSQVETVPPIGDERTESVNPVDLIDVQTDRTRGAMIKAVVAWRELMVQQALIPTRLAATFEDYRTTALRELEQQQSELLSRLKNTKDRAEFDQILSQSRTSQT